MLRPHSRFYHRLFTAISLDHFHWLKLLGGVAVRQAYLRIGQAGDICGRRVAAYLDMDQSESRESHTMVNVSVALLHAFTNFLTKIKL